jgi:hypothetical protein
VITRYRPAWDDFRVAAVSGREEARQALLGCTRRGLRPTDDLLHALVTVAEHVALTIESAQEDARDVRHRAALEHLLHISSRLRTRGTVTGCSSRCTTATARSTASSGQTIRPTGCCRRASASRRCACSRTRR